MPKLELTTGQAANIHDCLVQCRVIRVTQKDGEMMSPSVQLLTYLREQGQLSPTVIPFTDGALDQLLITFTCSHNRADKHLEFIETHKLAVDCSVIKLAVSKDMRNERATKAIDNGHHGTSATSDVGVSSSATTASPAAAGNQFLAEEVKMFKSTIASRVAITNILETIHEGGTFSFDFVMLITCAAIVAATGLITNGSVSIVASMLISPLMSPILSFTFGSVIKDWELVRVGVTSTLLGMLLCEIIGFVGGLIAAPAALRQSPPWPTNEMYSRGQVSSLYIGVAIAIPSGVAVALSITGSNTSGLVGVAISASLLPPVVNSGILFAQACFQTYYYTSDCNPTKDWVNCCVQNDQDFLVPGPSCPASDIALFCCSATQFNSADIAAMGGYSFLLTIVNIACIWIFASATFFLKEIAPFPNKSEFWSKMVPETRKYNVLHGRFSENFRLAAVQEAMSNMNETVKQRLHFTSPPATSIKVNKDVTAPSTRTLPVTTQ